MDAVNAFWQGLSCDPTGVADLQGWMGLPPFPALPELAVEALRVIAVATSPTKAPKRMGWACACCGLATLSYGGLGNHAAARAAWRAVGVHAMR